MNADTLAETTRDTLCINTLRFLAADMVENAHSGHPGLPMGAASMAYVLWTRFLRHSPRDPSWIDRDRFVLSAGHGSALLYALLHLSGYELPLEQLKRFRQWQSLSPGHPESHLTPGVEATTGPLGQGVANAVGMAIAEAHLAARYNRDDSPLFSHFTYALASDGDLMEGIASEACSLAGHLRLARLIVLYDNNHVTLSAGTPIAFTEDVSARYRAYGWQVIEVEDGNDIRDLEGAIEAAQANTEQPTLISVQTVLGYGAPEKEGTYGAHGSPLGRDELARAKDNLGWPTHELFHIPAEALGTFRERGVGGDEVMRAWNRRFDAYHARYPQLGDEITRRFLGELPTGWDTDLPIFAADDKGLATRKASEAVMQSIARAVPELVGGSGDLDPSTFTWLKGAGDFQSPRSSADVQGAVGGQWSYAGRNIHFGVREHAMAAAANGLVYHGGFRPYAATFFVFSDYMRPSIRLAALAQLNTIFVFTHDSVGVGEDGPSHQPIEHLASLRAIPNLLVLRPADANETRVAWRVALQQRTRPTALVLTRQSVPTLDRTRFAAAEHLERGAYVVNPDVSEFDVILLASGSEVGLVLGAAVTLATQGISARVVSMPSWRLFGEQSAAYRDAVLPAAKTARVVVEAASPLGWERFAGDRGAIVALDHFGASAPAPILFREFGLTVEHIVAQAQKLIEQERHA